MNKILSTLALSILGLGHCDAQIYEMRIYQSNGQVAKHRVQEIDSMNHQTVSNYRLRIRLKDASEIDYTVHLLQDFSYQGDFLQVTTAQGIDSYALSTIASLDYDFQSTASSPSTFSYGLRIGSNPLQGSQLNVEYQLKTTQHTRLQLINLSGQVLLEKTINDSSASLSLDLSSLQLSAGVYQLVLSNSKEHYSQKIIKY